MRKLFILSVCLLGLTYVGTSPLMGQNKEGEPRNEHLEKKRKERKKDTKKAVDERKKRHEEIQTRKTRKRMKKNRKRANRYNKGKKEPFYKRWFIRKK